MSNKFRLRIFAGPNGSGKSSILDKTREYLTPYKKQLDFGIYVNADNIAKMLKSSPLKLIDYDIKSSQEEFIEIAFQSGLIVEERFSRDQFLGSFEFTSNTIILVDQHFTEHLAQVVAEFLRYKLLLEKKKFTFETVFSDPSKIIFLKKAKAAGYKIYLYYVATEGPEINIQRVKDRVINEGGHHVDIDKIVKRYYKSLELLYEAAQLCKDVYFWDNSGAEGKLFVSFQTNEEGKRKWKWDSLIDNPINNKIPTWFIKYYVNKQPNQII